MSPPLLKARGKGGQRSVYAGLRRTSQPSAKKKGTSESAEIRKHENRKDAKGAKTKRGITTKNAEGVEGGFLITPHPFLLPGGEGTLERAIPEGAVVRLVRERSSQR